MTTVAMTIAGSDPSGGSGLQADLKTFHQHGVYGTGVVTMLTAQNTRGVLAVESLDPGFVAAQLDAVIDDVPPQAAKTGALRNKGVIEAVARKADRFEFPLIVDPVMISKHGDALVEQSAIRVMIDELLPRAFLVTPDVHEATLLAGFEVTDLVSMERAAAAIGHLGPRNVLVKGGGRAGHATDLLFSNGDVMHFAADLIDTRNTHGTGCVFSASITARLALGSSLTDAVAGAKQFITQAIRTAPGLGTGMGPVNMHVDAATFPSTARWLTNCSTSSALRPTGSLPPVKT